MEEYDPHLSVPDNWLDVDEDERVILVKEYHEKAGVQLPQEDAREQHAILHVIVENQIAMSLEPVPETMAKLIRQGLDRHESIHAIATILTEDICDLLNGNMTEFNPKRYRRKLEKLTAKRWRKGQF